MHAPHKGGSRYVPEPDCPDCIRAVDNFLQVLAALEQFIRRDGHGVLCKPWEDEDNECLPSCIQARDAIEKAKLRAL